MRRKPGHQPLHLVDLFDLGGTVLLRPALDLTPDIILAPAEIRQTERRRIQSMEPRERGIHRVIDRRALARLGIGYVRLPDHATVDMAHHIKRRADDAGLIAEEHRRGDGKALGMERADDPELAVDRMRGRQQLARRLAAQHEATRGRLQQIGGIRLPALELLHPQGTFEIRQS